MGKLHRTVKNEYHLFTRGHAMQQSNLVGVFTFHMKIKSVKSMCIRDPVVKMT